MKDKNLVLLITITLLMSIAASAFVVYKRISAEKANNSVELAADFGDIERLSMIQGVPVRTILAQLKNAGISAVALSEDISSSADMNMLSGIDPKKTNLYIPGKGLSSKKIGLIRGAGLRVIPRIRNSFDISGAIIERKIREISSFDTVIFAEEEVLGYPNYLKETAKALRANNMKYGYVEFGKQTGDTELVSYMGGNLVKVHGIPPDELENISREDAANRFVRAARERGVRILYIHFFQYPENGRDLLSTNLSFIKNLADKLTAEGLVSGLPSTTKKVQVSKLEKSLIGLGIADGAILLANYFVAVNVYLAIAALVLFALLPAKFLALLSAIVFPSYALVSMFPAKREPAGAAVISVSISTVFYISAITAAGAVFIAALLADRVHLIGIDAFMGVKLALVLPLVIVVSYFFFRKENEEKMDIKTAVSKIKDILDMNIKVSFAVLFILAAGIGALFILRSGNYGLPVTGLEKHARGLLERLLFVRPRTKEFLIGYPALVLASIYYMKGGKKWLWLWLSAGVLAPVSMVNSFCHVQTPVLISLVRSCIGLLLGIAVGSFVYLVYVMTERARLRFEDILK